MQHKELQGFNLLFIFGVANTILLTPAILAGIQFINKVEGKLPGTYTPTESIGTDLYSNLFLYLSINFIFLKFLTCSL